MTRRTTISRSLGTLVALALVGGCTHRAESPVDHPQTARATQREVAQVTDAALSQKLETFRSMKDFKQYLGGTAKHRAAQASPAEGYGYSFSDGAEEEAAAAPESAPAAPAPAASGESITNTQEQGVDEGGIVKTHGEHLVVLRRGRLFTVDLGRKSMRPIAALPVNPEKGHDAWYDEMLIHGDTIVIVGFSYQANATEIGLFRIDQRGNLEHRDTFFLRSNDYYSSRNYASRLFGDQLVFYMPYALSSNFGERDPDLPGVMPWTQSGRGSGDWRTIIDVTEIYRPIQETTDPVLHTVVTCDLSGEVRCKAKGIIGPYGRSFYVSREAVYVWVHDGGAGSSAEGRIPPAAVYRFPLAGGDPGALRVWGAPVDQFSFKESEDGHLNVLVMASSEGDAMWGAEFAGEDVAMLRVPTAAMATGVNTVKASAYVDLPEPKGNGSAFQNRFVGDTLLYGRGSGWGGPDSGRFSLHLYSVQDRRAGEVGLPHGIDRIEAMGDAAVVIGADGGNLHFTSLDLQHGGRVAGEFLQPNAAQGELRSHGFFFRPEGPGDGKLGLPIRGGGAPGYEHLAEGSAAVLYLDVRDLGFHRLGSLASDPRASQDDRCEVSCVDWYGNARPIFYRGRVFALLGYELVEGRIDRGKIEEVDRVNMMHLINAGERGVVWKDL